jgi:riboflavin kinase/FMN adenylyltransferase
MLAACIGNFDGVHRGHAALLAEARRLAGAGGRVVAVTFDPPPAVVLGRPGPFQRLCGVERRATLLQACGADEVLLLETTPALLSLEPEAFIGHLLGRIPFGVVVEGPDFRFGRDRRGDLVALAAIGEAMGFQVATLPSVEVPLPDGTLLPVRSSLVRWLLSQGRVSEAEVLLGRPHLLAGRVVRGDQRGRSLGCPTANLEPTESMQPREGVYAGEATLPDGRAVPAAISVGRKQTFAAADAPPVCEAHLLGVELPLDQYGWPMELRFGRWIRGQMPFPSPEALVAQMARDLEQVACWWRRSRRNSPPPASRQAIPS